MNINNFKSLKDYTNFMLGQALYFTYKDNYELMKKVTYSFKDKRTTKYNYYVKYKNAISFYLANRGDTLNDERNIEME